MPVLAISDEFFEALARLPRQQQKKVREFTKKFHADPKAAAINYEKIHNMSDDRVRTVRIDKKYRAVVLHPDDGEVHVLVWVDNHDEAMDWARNKRFDVHPETGALQILNVEAVSASLERMQGPAKTESCLFRQSDNNLASLGIPAILLPAVRAITQSNQLYELRGVLPEEALEALIWLAEGESIESVRELIGQPNQSIAPSKISVDEAIENPQSSRRLLRIRSASELEQILAAPLERWRVFLHPQQRFIVDHHFSGPALIIGGAGTGKTIVAMHRAKKLAESLVGSQRLLFTTFTANLAENVKRLLKDFCGDEFERIDVVHLHACAMQWCKCQQPLKIANLDEIAAAWDQVAVDLDPRFNADFLRDEWDDVFRIKGIRTREEYLTLSRVGRTPSLSRRDRVTVWTAFESLMDVMRQGKTLQWSDVIQQATKNIAGTATSPYQHVIVDEAQDFDAIEWRFIRSLVPVKANDLFLVADPRQRIYQSPVALSDCGVDVSDRIHRLQVNYRTTEQIRSWATCQTILSERHDLVSNDLSEVSTHSLLDGPEPEKCHSVNLVSEATMLATLLVELSHEFSLEEIVIAVRANWILNDLKKTLKECGMAFQVIDQQGAVGEGVRLATMHRVKGLEFRCVVIAGITRDVFPAKYRGRQDDVAFKVRHLTSERNLLYVAATRARERLILSSVGEEYHWDESVDHPKGK